jgi:capsular polysaccharide biosynthesis protein
MVGEKRKVILLPVGCAIKLDKLIQVSVTGYVPFGRRDRKFKNHGNGVFNPLALKNMRDKIIAKCNNKKTNARIEKIYFQRKSAHRNVQNIQELEGILEKNGYSFLDPSALSFINQVNLLRNANNVIASTGAAMCNAIFCNENSKIIVLMGKHEDMIYRYWANMLQPIGMNVIYILGEQSNASETSIHGNFQINMEWFRWVIND